MDLRARTVKMERLAATEPTESRELTVKAHMLLQWTAGTLERKHSLIRILQKSDRKRTRHSQLLLETLQRLDLTGTCKTAEKCRETLRRQIISTAQVI